MIQSKGLLKYLNIRPTPELGARGSRPHASYNPEESPPHGPQEKWNQSPISPLCHPSGGVTYGFGSSSELGRFSGNTCCPSSCHGDLSHQCFNVSLRPTFHIPFLNNPAPFSKSAGFPEQTTARPRAGKMCDPALCQSRPHALDLVAILNVDPSLCRKAFPLGCVHDLENDMLMRGMELAGNSVCY